MSKFKVGDKVVTLVETPGLEGSCDAAPVGSGGVVIRSYGHSAALVHFDGRGADFVYDDHELRLDAAQPTSDLKPRGVKAQWWLFPFNALGALTELSPLQTLLTVLQSAEPGDGEWLDSMQLLWDELGVTQEEVLQVLEYGAAKYTPNNWRNANDGGMPAFRREYFSALARHCKAIDAGQEIDPVDATPPGSGLPHRAHAGCNILFWLSHELELSNPTWFMEEAK